MHAPGLSFDIGFNPSVILNHTPEMNKRLLLVESHDHLRKLLGGFLSQSFDVTGARDALEAMAWLGAGLAPDVILADAGLAKISGAQFVTALRNSGLHGDIPVLVIGDDPEEEHRFLQNGASAYLDKPFDPLFLQQLLAKLTARVPAVSPA